MQMKQNLFRRSLAFVIIVLAAVLFVIPAGAAEKERTLNDLNLSDFTNWRSGVYSNLDGQYRENAQRICLKEYVTGTAEKYTIHISDKSYHLLIRELSEQGQMLSSWNLTDGEVYAPDKRARYIGISLYKVTGEHTCSYKSFRNMFAEGFSVEMTAENVTEETDFWRQFENWRTGMYHWMTGSYMEMENRLCLKEWISLPETEYTVTITDKSYHMLIREIDKNGKMIKSLNLADGETYVPGENAERFAISIYRYAGEHAITYETYRRLFQSGFCAKLTAKEAQIPVEEPSDKTLEEVIREMLLTGEQNPRNVSSYQVKYTDFMQIYNRLIEGDCYLAYQTYYGMYPNLTEGADGIILTATLYGADAGFAARYEKMKQKVKEALSGIDSRMSDVEKTLVLHDYVTEHVAYDASYPNNGCASVALVEGKAKCTGYSSAFAVLLHEAGIESCYASSSSLNHMWLAVKLDGAYYHADPTWADTRSRREGQTDHTFFLRSDAQFQNTATNAHYGWNTYGYDIVCDSGRFDDWFVHEVTGKMRYRDGFWYYADGNRLLRSDIDGSTKTIIAQEEAPVELLELTEGKITYRFGENIQTILITQ